VFDTKFEFNMNWSKKISTKEVNNLTPKTKSEILYSIPDSIIFNIINEEGNITQHLKKVTCYS